MNIHDWKRVLQFYAAWLRRIEMGLNSWRDDSSTTHLENAMLFNKSFGKLLGRESSSKSGQTWWCQDFNNNKCSVNSASHQKNILGQSRLVQHICRTCWRIDKNSCNTQKILLRVHTNFDKVIMKLSPGEITKVELNFKRWQIIIFKILNFALMIQTLNISKSKMKLYDLVVTISKDVVFH